MKFSLKNFLKFLSKFLSKSLSEIFFLKILSLKGVIFLHKVIFSLKKSENSNSVFFT